MRGKKLFCTNTRNNNSQENSSLFVFCDFSTFDITFSITTYILEYKRTRQKKFTEPIILHGCVSFIDVTHCVASGGNKLITFSGKLNVYFFTDIKISSCQYLCL